MRSAWATTIFSITKAAPGFECKTDGPGYAAARQVLEEANGKPVGDAGSGGSIPLSSEAWMRAAA